MWNAKATNAAPVWEKELPEDAQPMLQGYGVTANLEMSTAIGQRTVTADEIAAFACLTGDFSRMHLDHEFARASGLPGPVAHGLLSACWALGALTLHAPERMGVGVSDAYVSGFSIRLARVVVAGDTLSFRWRNAPEPDASSSVRSRTTAIEVLNQRDEVVSSGRLTLCTGSQRGACDELPDPPGRWSVEAVVASRPPAVYFAEDVFEFGPRGELLGRTLTETDVVSFANRMGELNPLYLNAGFASGSRFGGRIAPPMLTFCFGFADFLRELLRIPLPSADFAGHLGDAWNFYRPVSIGDTLRVVHQPLSCVRSRSRPEMALLRFGLQLVNQDDVVVQDGEVTMMIPGRTQASHRSSGG